MPTAFQNSLVGTHDVSRRSVVSNMRMIVREAARAERAQQQSQARLEAAHRRAVREAERQAKADSKEAARLHLASQMEEAELLTREIQEREQAINTLLTRALAKNPAIDLKAILKTFVPARFDEKAWTSSAPDRRSFTPSPPSFFARIVPGAARRHQRAQQEADRLFDAANAAHLERVSARARAFKAFETAEAARKAALERDNDSIREMQRGLTSGEHAAIIAYFKLVIDRSLEGEPDAVSAEAGYSPESRHMVVDLELPEFSVIPEESGFKYIKLKWTPKLGPEA